VAPTARSGDARDPAPKILLQIADNLQEKKDVRTAAKKVLGEASGDR
jgi:hypothetical protein